MNFKRSTITTVIIVAVALSLTASLSLYFTATLSARPAILAETEQQARLILNLMEIYDDGFADQANLADFGKIVERVGQIEFVRRVDIIDKHCELLFSSSEDPSRNLDHLFAAEQLIKEDKKLLTKVDWRQKSYEIFFRFKQSASDMVYILLDLNPEIDIFYRFRDSMIAAAVLALALVLAAVICILYRLILVHLKNLQVGIQKVADGNFSHAIQPRGTLEIQRVTVFYNQMIREISRITGDLREARRKSENLSRAKSEFFFNMSHELRTPLNLILGYTDVIMEEGGSPSITDKIHIIHNAGHHLYHVINDILDLSRIDAQKMALNYKPFYVRRCLEDTCRLFDLKARQNHLAFHFYCSPLTPEKLEGDEQRISQILFNLLGNAFKYTRRGSVEVDADYKDDRLLLSVSDSGKGIDKKDQERVFELFSRARDDDSGPVEGAGLGLALVKRICDSMGGEITLRSQPGQGSVFSLALPLKVTGGRVQERKVINDHRLALINDQKLKVLLVEDKEENRVLIKLLLKDFPLKICEAQNGEQALKILGRQEFDLMLLDLQMPVLDGYQVLEKIKNENPQMAPPFIFALTAYDTSVAEIGSPLCREVIKKPVQKEILRQKIAFVLQQIHNKKGLS